MLTLRSIEKHIVIIGASVAGFFEFSWCGSDGSKSVRLNTALAVSGLTPLLVARLENQDAIARLTLLKLIRVRHLTKFHI